MLSLPLEYYTSAAFLREERRLVLGRSWSYAGHARQLRQPGHFLAVETGGESVVLVRGDEGELRGFRNECRHRGYPFCDQPAGRVGSFRCPFHAWTYALDGRLLDAGGVPDGPVFDYRERGLYRVAVEVWRDLIFVCPAPDVPPSMGAAVESLAPELARLELERLKPAATRAYPVAANWKLALEQHPYCASRAGSHPELEQVLDLGRLRGPSAEPPSTPFVADAPGLSEAAVTASRDGQPVAPQLPGLAASPGWTAGLRTQPAQLEILAYPDHVVVHSLSATRVDRSRWSTHWLVHEDAEEGRDYRAEELVFVWDETLKRHLRLVEQAWQEARLAGFPTAPARLEAEPRVRATLKAYVLALEAAGAA